MHGEKMEKGWYVTGNREEAIGTKRFMDINTASQTTQIAKRPKKTKGPRDPKAQISPSLSPPVNALFLHSLHTE